MSIQDSTPPLSHTVTLHDGQDYEFAPFTPTLWSKFCRWINKMDGASPNRIVTTDKMFEAADSIDGLLCLAHLSVSKAHPDMTAAKLGEIVNMDLLNRIFHLCADLPESDKESDNGSGSDPPVITPLTG